jgi:hypothetical protein
MKENSAHVQPQEVHSNAARAVTKNKKKKVAPSVHLPSFIAWPLQRQSSSLPFDEDDVPSDVSCSMDEESKGVGNVTAVAISVLSITTSCKELKVSPSCVPSEEELPTLVTITTPTDVKLLEVSRGVTQRTKEQERDSNTVKTTPPTKTTTANTTPETQASSEGERDLMDAYSHVSPDAYCDDDGHNNTRNTTKRLFCGFGSHEHDNTPVLEEGNFSVAKPDDYIGDDLKGESNNESHNKRTSSRDQRNHRRCLFGCFLFSLVMIVATAGVAFYMFVFKRDDNRSNKESVHEPVTSSPTLVFTQEPMAPSESSAPSLVPPFSAVPSDLRSFPVSIYPSGIPSTMPSISPSVFPSTGPTKVPTPDYSTSLKDYLFGFYGVIFEDDSAETQQQSPSAMAVEWLNQEARQTLRVGNIEEAGDVAQRFALLALEFSMVNLDLPVTEGKDSHDFWTSLGERNETMTDASATAINSTASESTIFFGRVRQASIPSGMWSSEFLVHQCEWTGIVCNGDNYVTQVRWDNRFYTGNIPSEIRILTTLTHLDLSNNHLEGPIPEDLYHLTDLEKLYLFKNFLTGTISSRIGDLDKITHFHISHNYLTGPIPEELKSDRGSEDGIRPLSKYSMAWICHLIAFNVIPDSNLFLVSNRSLFQCIFEQAVWHYSRGPTSSTSHVF